MRLRIIIWIRSLVKSLLDNPAMVKIVFIPGMIFFLDFTLRAILEIDLIDAGADMALLAVAMFFTVIVEDFSPKQHTPMAIVFILFFLILWIICLKIVSLPNPIIVFSFDVIDFRLVLSWLIGILAFVFSGILSEVVIQDVFDQSIS